MPPGVYVAAACLAALLLASCTSGEKLFARHDYEAAEPLLQSALADCGKDLACEQLATLQLGSSQLALEELTDAEKSLRLALALARQLGVANSQALAASQLAQVLLEGHHYPEAFDEAKRADQLADQQQLRATAKGTMAMAAAGMGNLDAAEKLSYQIAQPGDAYEATLRQLSIRAAIFRREGDCSQAEKLLKEILVSTYGTAGDPASLDAHLGLARCARRLGNAAAEREQLSQARLVMQQKEQSLRGKALTAWHRQTLPLQAAEREAAGITGDHIPAGEAYAFALLYEADGDVRAELRAAARVAATSDYGPAALALSQPLRQRVLIVQGPAIWLRKAPEEGAGHSAQLRPGSWIELLLHKGGWLHVRTQHGSGFLEQSYQAGGGLRPVTDSDLR